MGVRRCPWVTMDSSEEQKAESGRQKAEIRCRPGGRRDERDEGDKWDKWDEWDEWG